MEIILNIFAVMVQLSLYIFLVIAISKIFIKERINKKQFIFTIILSILNIIICSIVKTFIPLANVILGFVFIFINFKFIFKLNTPVSIVLSFITFIFVTLSELFSFYILNLIFRIDKSQISTGSIYLFYLLIIQCILAFTFLKILSYLLNKYTNLYTLIEEITNKQLIIFLSLLMLCVIPQLLIFIFNKYSYPAYFLVITTIQITIICFIILIYTNKSLEKDKAETDLVATRLHNETMSGMVDGLKTLKHDFNNIIQTLSGYSKAKDYDELDVYIDKLLKEFKVVNTLGTIDPEIFNEPGIYGIVGAKYFLITNNDITMDIEVFTNIKEINFPMSELARILGILLDNAYEATQKAKNPYVRLEIKYDSRKCADIIRVINTYDTNITIDLDNIYKKGFSSKKVKSGIGLWEVKKIISKISNSQIYTTLENDKFIQNLIIEK